MTKSLIDYAYDYMSKQSEQVSFADLWAYVTNEAGLTEDEAANKVAQFYTNLMLDGRFVTLGENQWDLRVRHTFDKVHIDMKDVYSDVEESEDVDTEDDEQQEYNEVFEEPKDDDSDNSSDEDEPSEEETL